MALAETRRQLHVTPLDGKLAVLAGFGERDRDLFSRRRSFRFLQGDKHRVELRVVLGPPLAVLSVKNQLPGIVSFLLGPEAVDALRNLGLPERQVAAGRKRGGRIGAPPEPARGQLAKQVLNAAPFQVGPAVINGHRFPADLDFRLAASILLRTGGARQREEHSKARHSQ